MRSLPLTRAGKIDRKALRQRVEGAAAPTPDRDAPTLTDRIAAIWQSVLHCPPPARATPSSTSAAHRSN
ncbi:hypothetical protein [Pseudooceanicola sp. LIPI14-2-Ac024]|uniref:hypothetical protein n=1 Tax=Pseudooceanicola sp. LIPI14-2-Ac024 TaxID=3344875 RepID=UPI0035D01837